MPIEFDYIIAGGGSAGCVLASRLAGNSNDSICLIEAGGKGKNLFIKMPAGNGFIFGIIEKFIFLEAKLWVEVL